MRGVSAGARAGVLLHGGFGTLFAATASPEFIDDARRKGGSRLADFNGVTIDPAAVTGYAPGRFLRVDSSRSSFKLDVKLTDQANDLGGSLANGITVLEEFLVMRDYVIIPIAPLPF